MGSFMAAASGAAAVDGPFRIAVLGDSLSAGYGLPASAAFPARLEQALTAKGIKVTVANAAVSGNTVADGLARLDWSIPDGTDAVILELGANDALRGFDPAITRRGLTEIVKRLKQRKIEILLAGMLAPRNMGEAYGRSFDAIYPQLAEAEDLLLYPFFLEGVAADPKLNLPDGLHPTAEGIGVIVERILPTVEKLIARLRARS